MKATAASALLAAALAAVAPARAAEDDFKGTMRETALEDEAAYSAQVERVADTLSDPETAERLASRVLRSKLSDAVTKDTDPARRRKAVREWIEKDPKIAAEIAIGLARDDARGDRHFEDTTMKAVYATFEYNRGAGGSLGALRETAAQSRLIQRASGDLTEEQKREQLRTLFEGRGGGGEGTVGGPPEGKGGPKPSGAGGAGPVGTSATTLRDGYYDRLSAANVRGYSPQLVAMQSALNARRPPGTPALVETGKLDHPTLAFPGHGMRHDARNLAERLRRDELLALARAAGHTLSEEDFKHPDLKARLAAKAAGKRLPASLERRARALARLDRAVADFQAAADRSRDPSAITKALLVELGGRQREAARWIAAAAIEEDLSRLENDEGFLTPEALAAVDAVPAALEVREAYKKRGEALDRRLKDLRSNAEAALAALESDGWESRLGEVERLMAANARLKKDLAADVAAWKTVPRLVAESLVVQARWRRWAEDLAVRFAPRSSFAREATARRERLSRSAGAFRAIAAGDAAAGRAALDSLAR